MNQQMMEIVSNELIASKTYRMVLKGDVSCYDRPGKFMNIAIEGKYLRRPISVSDVYDDKAVIIYKTVGEGTKWLSEQPVGKKLDVLNGLGNGFDVSKEYPLIVAGGLGVAPVYGLAKQLNNPIVVLGFRSQEDMFLIDEFEKISSSLYVCTNDGSYGERGFVTDVMVEEGLLDMNYYCCGPLVMMKQVRNLSNGEGEISLEERMGCGFGACMGCSIETLNGPKRICKEGPVFESKELLWED